MNKSSFLLRQAGPSRRLPGVPPTQLRTRQLYSSAPQHARVVDSGTKVDRLINFEGTFLQPTSEAQTGWKIECSPVVARSRNPIRHTLASVTATPPSSAKTLINLGLGDPTHYPLHPPPPAAINSVVDIVTSGQSNGYVPGVGTLWARHAIANYHARWDKVRYDPGSIVLTHGVGQALDMIFSILFPSYSPLSPTNILLPKPGFSQYSTLLANLGTEIRYYDCLEGNNWEVDMNMLDRQCDVGTRAILLTNPSNPCGSNYSLEHLQDILRVAEKHKVPIIADEIYGHMTWKTPFVPLASLSRSVPIITVSGLSKRFLLPGWRLGWLALHDPLGVASSFRDGTAVWADRFFGPNSLVQAALPGILNTGAEWFDEVLLKLETNAMLLHRAISSIPGLSCTFGEGALYMLVRIDPSLFTALGNDVDFARALYLEESLFVLPGMCFEAHGYFRIVIASPTHVMKDVVERLRNFCARHSTRGAVDKVELGSHQKQL